MFLPGPPNGSEPAPKNDCEPPSKITESSIPDPNGCPVKPVVVVKIEVLLNLISLAFAPVNLCAASWKTRFPAMSPSCPAAVSEIVIGFVPCSLTALPEAIEKSLPVSPFMVKVAAPRVASNFASLMLFVNWIAATDCVGTLRIVGDRVTAPLKIKISVVLAWAAVGLRGVQFPGQIHWLD